MNIEMHGSDAIVDAGDIAFTFSSINNPRDFHERRKERGNVQWNQNIGYVEDYTIFPFGENNDLPDVIREVVSNHHAAPGMINKSKQMLIGHGPFLYRQVIDNNNNIVRELVKDNEITDWLESWDATTYLIEQAEDYYHINAAFSKFYLTRGSRLGKPKFAKLETVNAVRCRLAAKTKDLMAGRVDRPTHAAVNPNWFVPERIFDYKIYELFDINDPFRKENSIIYSNEYSFAQDVYTLPDIFGSLEWLKRSTAVPLIFKALSTNAINLKYHVESPAAFWDKKREVIQAEVKARGGTYREKMLEDYKRDFLRKVAEVLSGEHNTGKFWHTEKVVQIEHTNIIEHGWTIKVIDQKIKDFVDAQIAISNAADLAVSAGIGLAPALGGVNDNSKANSGSEQRYIYLNHVNSGVYIPEMVVCKPLNYAIKCNWPDKDVRIGFMRQTTKADQDITPSERLGNQNTQ